MKGYWRDGLLLCVLAGLARVSCNEEAQDQSSQIRFWEPLGPTSSGSVLSLAVSPEGSVFAGTETGIVFRRLSEAVNWEQVAVLPPEIRALTITGDSQLVAGTSSSPYFSTDNGTSWTKAAMGLPGYSSQVLSLINRPTGEIFAGTIASDETSGGVSVSKDGGASWSAQGLYRRHVYSLAIDMSGAIYAGARPEFSSIDGGVFRSIDDGVTWTHADSGLPDDTVWSLSANSDYIVFAGTTSNGLFLSSDNGENWIRTNSSLAEETVHAIALNSLHHVFVATPTGVYRSTDFGLTWEQINSGLTDTSILSLTVDSEGFLWVGSEQSGVFRTVRSTVP